MAWTDLTHEIVSAGDVHDAGGHRTFDFDSAAHWQNGEYVEVPDDKILLDRPSPWANDFRLLQEALDAGLLERVDGQLVPVFVGDELSLGADALAKLYGSQAA